MATDQLEIARQHELAEFLRTRRARLTPEQVGLPRGTRRRTPGLRREEVALLAGVSPEWYTWLEQGRDITVSVQLLESLTRVLQLDADEREHLFLLALGQPAPIETATTTKISPTLQQFLNQLEYIPTCVVDARLNVLTGNAAYLATFVDFRQQLHHDERARNLIWRLFTLPIAQQRNKEWDELARVYIAQFRAEYGRFIKDPWWTEQISELSRVSPEFRRLWARHNVLHISEGQKHYQHPIVGEMVFDFLWLQKIEPYDQRLLIHTPRVNTGTKEKVEQLLALMAERDKHNRQGDMILSQIEV